MVQQYFGDMNQENTDSQNMTTTKKECLQIEYICHSVNRTVEHEELQAFWKHDDEHN